MSAGEKTSENGREATMTQGSIVKCIEANKDAKITIIGRKLIEAAEAAKTSQK